MNSHEIVSPLVVLDEAGALGKLVGSAFPITPDGGFLTCLHAVNRADDQGEPVRVALLDLVTGDIVPIREHVASSASSGLDIAYVRLARSTPCYLPFLEPDLVTMGERINMVGYYESKGGITVGSFTGTIAGQERTKEEHAVMRLPFPVIEGMSGSPLITFHNGTKAVGMAFGSESARIQAYEIIEAQDGSSHYHETAYRVVEFGLAYHASAVISFLQSVGVEPRVSSEALDIPGLDD